MRSKIVAGNWKMNNDAKETESLLNEIKKIDYNCSARIMIAPSFVQLSQALTALEESSIEVVAQNMHEEESGAFTGEVSAKMLKSINVDKVILGHSERRLYYNETNESLAKKVKTALKYDMEIIFCFGEEQEDRKSKKHFDVIKQQLSESLFDLPIGAWEHIILAYEPVWAIGTGETASPEQAQEMHSFIRNLISEKYDYGTASETSILYGGSIKPSNAQAIFSRPDVDGGLIGGASLKVDEFMAITMAF